MLSCEGTGSCYISVTEIDLNVNAVEPIFNFEAFKFLGEASGASATIILRNDQNAQLLTIDRIECLALESCAGTTFVTGYYVGITEIICQPGACFGCKIKTFIDDVLYVPCDPKQDYVIPPPSPQRMHMCQSSIFCSFSLIKQVQHQHLSQHHYQFL